MQICVYVSCFNLQKTCYCVNIKQIDVYWLHVFCLVFIGQDQCGQMPDVLAKHKLEKKVYDNQEIVQVECESEKCCWKCNNGEWEKKICRCKTLFDDLTNLCDMCLLQLSQNILEYFISFLRISDRNSKRNLPETCITNNYFFITFTMFDLKKLTYKFFSF